MSENLKTILNAQNIPGETETEKADRLGIPESYTDLSVKSELQKIYKDNPKLSGNLQTIENKLLSAIKSEIDFGDFSVPETNKIDTNVNPSKPNINSKENQKMDELDFGATSDLNNLKTNAQGNTTPTAPKQPKIVALNAGAEAMKQKIQASTANAQAFRDSHVVKEVISKKKAKAELIEEFAAAANKAIYTHGKQVRGCIGYLVKPSRNGVDYAKLQKAVTDIQDKLVAATGYDPASKTCANCEPAYFEAVADLYDKLTKAAQVITEDDKMEALPQNAAPAEGSYEILAGNTTFLVDPDKMASKRSIQGVITADGSQYKSSTFSNEMIKAFCPAVAHANGKTIFEAKARESKNAKGDKVASYSLGVKNRNAITSTVVANNMTAGKTAYVKSAAKISDIVYTKVGTNGKAKKAHFTFQVFVPVNGTPKHNSKVTVPELLVKVQESKGSSRGNQGFASVEEYFSNQANLENLTNKFANNLKSIEFAL